MPFTVSHVAAVLPLRRAPGSRWSLPVAPLVIGSMVPDLPTFLRQDGLRAATHAASGIVTVDLALTVACGLLWTFGLRAPVMALAPGLSRRMGAPEPLWPSGRGDDWNRWGRWLLAAVVGSATHVLWDSFTHADSRLVPYVPVLLHDIAGLPLCAWLQYLSSVLGLVVLAVWSWRWWRAGGRVDDAVEVRWRPAVIVLLGLLTVGLPVGLHEGLSAGAGTTGTWRWRVVAAQGAFAGGAAVLAAIAALTVAWHVLVALRGRRPSEQSSVR